jgi:ClpP class serine protease
MDQTKQQNLFGAAMAGFFLGNQPLAMIEDSATALIDRLSNSGNWDIEALAAKTGQRIPGTGITMRGKTAVLNVVGPIMRRESLLTRYFNLTTLEDLSRDFAAIQGEDQDKIKNIVLVFDSPGGQATGIAEMAQMIRQSKKPVTAYVDGMAASAAYWLASAASKIVVSKTAMLGSIGAVMTVSLDRQDGIVRLVSGQSPLKRPDPLTDDGREELQTRVDTLADVFVSDVAAYRQVSVETVLEDFGRGGIRMGEEAVKLGMADEVSTFEELVAG